MGKKKVYEVQIVRTMVGHVQVVAEDESEAEDLAAEYLENGGEPYYEDGDEPELSAILLEDEDADRVMKSGKAINSDNQPH